MEVFLMFYDGKRKQKFCCNTHKCSNGKWREKYNHARFINLGTETKSGISDECTIYYVNEVHKRTGLVVGGAAHKMYENFFFFWNENIQEIKVNVFEWVVRINERLAKLTEEKQKKKKKFKKMQTVPLSSILLFLTL